MSELALTSAVVNLTIWTVFDHPADDPEVFVARAFKIAGPAPQPTQRVLRAHTLDEIRRELAGMGLVALQRSPEDDPTIVESWL